MRRRRRTRKEEEEEEEMMPITAGPGTKLCARGEGGDTGGGEEESVDEEGLSCRRPAVSKPDFEEMYAHKGVRLRESGRWEAQVCCKGKKTCVGIYD